MAKKNSSEKIAQALGADSVWSALQTDRRGKKFFYLTTVTKRGRKRKRVYELSEEEVRKHKLLGVAEGQFFLHCVSMAGRYTKNFHKRVCGFRLLEPKHKKMPMRVAFYEKA